MSASRFCPACGAEVRPAARFCHRCGAGMDGQRPAGAVGGGASGGASNLLPWSVAGIALLCLLAFIVGQNFRKAPAQAAAAPAAGPFAGAAGGAPGRAPDISQMGPEERADRLFQRVMTYVAEGKSDSVQFFSPMAIQSMQALAPLDAHRRYDLGLLGMVSGDAAMARAQSDSILAAAPNHLLGLVLAMRTAGMQLDSTARRGYVTRFIEVVDRERASGKQEYVD
ncbi:MAG: zinc ribbon domain-containing protein, partial [Gemmatimonadota bacterium]|nr:zinc ribbon domain-containing protein [Gemmatimonadota bacterium]